MSGFSNPLWYTLIFVATIGGMLGLFLLTQRLSTKPQDEEDHVWDEDLRELHNPLPRWWVALFYITIGFSALYLMLYPGLRDAGMFLSWSSVGQYEEEVLAHEARFGPLYASYIDTPVEELIYDKRARRIGQRLFATYCTTCHGSDGRGVRGFPNLADSDWLYGGTAAAIKTSIRDGRNGAMPAWRDALGSDSAVADVVQFVLEFTGRADAPDRVERGAVHYQTLCVACHGPEGQGNQQVGAPNLTDDVWLYGADTQSVTKSVAEGRFGVMPAHGEILGEARLHLLATYVYSLSTPGQ